MTSNVEDEFADGAAAAAEAEAKQQKEKEQSRPKHIKFDDNDAEPATTKQRDDAGGDDDNGKQQHTNADDSRLRTDPARCEFEKDKSRMAK
jgi:hypothetical protein